MATSIPIYIVKFDKLGIQEVSLNCWTNEEWNQSSLGLLRDNKGSTSTDFSTTFAEFKAFVAEREINDTIQSQSWGKNVHFRRCTTYSEPRQLRIRIP